MTKKIIETELSRCTAAVTEQRLLDHYQLLVESNLLYEMSPKERADLFFEFRSLIKFKKDLENEQLSKDNGAE